VPPNSSIMGLLMKYLVVLKRTDEGYSVFCPGLPGCWSQGETDEEAMDNIQDAIQEYLAAVADSLKGEDVRQIEITV
jgi:predicted RNase H-like HicB family nuclease